MFPKTVNLYKNAFSGLSTKIWMLAIVMLINRSGTMVIAFMTLYCKEIGFSLKQGGLVVAIYGLGSVSGALIGGKLTDKFGFHKIQYLSLFFGGLLFILLGQMQNYSSICICTFILAMVNETFRPANSTAIAHYSTIKNRTQSFALVRLAINLGWGIGIAIGGIIASMNYSYLFWVDGFTNIGASICMAFLLPAVSLSEIKAQHKEETNDRLGTRPYQDKVFLAFLVLQLLYATCFFQLFTTIPVYFKTGLRLTEFQIGVIMSLNGILIALFEMILVFKLEGQKPYLVLMTYGSILMAVFFLALTLPPQFGVSIALLAIIIITASEMVAMPFMNTYYLARTTLETRGAYAGMYTMAWSIAQMLGSSSGTIIAEQIGFTSLWILLAIVSLATGAGYYLLFVKTERK